MKLLYLLALAQLVGGPLVLLQVTVFCKLAVREAPKAGVSQAAEKAWKSSEFQTLLAEAVPGNGVHRKDPVPPSGDPKSKLDPVKQPFAPWMGERLVISDHSAHGGVVDIARVWTPAWPQAPPGPPPRVG